MISMPKINNHNNSSSSSANSWLCRLQQEKMSPPSADMLCGRPSNCRASTVTAAPSGERLSIFVLFATTMATLIDAEAFLSGDLDFWPFNKNWHFTYSCPGERLCQFWFFYFYVFELRACTGQTDKQTDRQDARRGLWDGRKINRSV